MYYWQGPLVKQEVFMGFSFHLFLLYTVANAFSRIKRPRFFLGMHILPIKGDEWNVVLSYVIMNFKNFVPILFEMMNKKI